MAYDIADNQRVVHMRVVGDVSVVAVVVAIVVDDVVVVVDDGAVVDDTVVVLKQIHAVVKARISLESNEEDIHHKKNQINML